MVDIRTLSRVVIGAVLYYVAATTLLHVLEPDMDPVANPMSAYVLTGSGTLMTTTYFVQAAALIALVDGLRRVLPRSMMQSIGFALFALAALAAATSGVFPGESPPPHTLSGIIHLTGGVIYSFAIASAVVLTTLSMRKDARWGGAGALVTALAVGVVIGTALFPIMAASGAGLAQRISFAVTFAWMLVVAHQMPKIATVVSEVPGHAARS